LKRQEELSRGGLAAKLGARRQGWEPGGIRGGEQRSADWPGGEGGEGRDQCQSRLGSVAVRDNIALDPLGGSSGEGSHTQLSSVQSDPPTSALRNHRPGAGTGFGGLRGPPTAFLSPLGAGAAAGQSAVVLCRAAEGRGVRSRRSPRGWEKFHVDRMGLGFGTSKEVAISPRGGTTTGALKVVDQSAGEMPRPPSGIFCTFFSGEFRLLAPIHWYSIPVARIHTRLGQRPGYDLSPTPPPAGGPSGRTGSPTRS